MKNAKNATKTVNTLALAILFGVLTPAHALEVQIPISTSKTENPVAATLPSTSSASTTTSTTASATKAAAAATAVTEPVSQPAATRSEAAAATPPAKAQRSAATRPAAQSDDDDRYLQQVNMPEVPAGVIKRGGNAEPAYTGMAKINDSAVLIVEPGVNQIVPVAADHLNRFVMPFGTPVVTTMSEATTTTDIKQNVVYIGTSSKEPVTAFITEKGDQSRAVSLTLVPQLIPPREVFVRLSDGYSAGVPYSNPAAERWEMSQPYVEAVRSVFRSTALGELPQGYAMAKVSGSIHLPNCEMAGLDFNFTNGQVLSGHSLSVLIGVARNVTGDPIEFKEAACGDWDVAAVAAWPRNVLEPGEMTEIYVARRVNAQKPATSKRPSLLGGYR